MRGGRGGGRGRTSGGPRKGSRNGASKAAPVDMQLEDMPGLNAEAPKKVQGKKVQGKPAAAPQPEAPKAITLAEMNEAELKEQCAQRGIADAGTNAELLRRVQDFDLLTTAVSLGPNDAERGAAIVDLVASLTTVEGLLRAKRMKELALIATVEAVLTKGGKQTGPARGGAVALVTALVNDGGKSTLPLVVTLISPLLALSSDKVKKVKVASEACLAAILSHASDFAPRVLLPELLKKTSSWQANEARMNIVASLTETCPNAVKYCLAEAIPAVADLLHDLKKQVKVASLKALKGLCAAGANDDLLVLLPVLMSALAKTSEIPECVQTIASTTFVQTVDGPTLAIIAPILTKGFAVRSDKTKRSCARIIENMCKLVEEPSDLVAFLPQILPRLEIARERVATPEAREVCNAAHAMLILKSAGGAETNLEQFLISALSAAGFEADSPSSLAYTNYTAELVASLVDIKSFDIEIWNNALLPFLECMIEEDAARTVVANLLEELKVISGGEEKEDEEDQSAEELCNCEFSLAYGNKVLLRKTNLKLKRGFKYGLIGKNDSGKTSLMRAIADHRVDGFPAEDELRTVFVETDIQGELSDLTVLDYIMADELLADLNITREAMTETLNNVGFTDDSPANVTTVVGALSGGWKMKLALARAMLLNADILLLDEPTNHLDSYNVKWVEDYLQSLTNVTCVMVSHDSGFLNRVCTHIVQIDSFRLSFHKGNLEAFVKNNPGASEAFFELKTDKFKFKFPEPGRLKGVKSKGKAIMKMKDISFTYPGASKPQLKNVSIQVSLGSRVACVGVNGAGKSTMIKLLTGELEPDQGSGAVWTHPNMQYGYIAQHAFHHIENHLDKTANEYTCWRYRYGNDREALNKITQIVTDEEQKAMEKSLMFEFLNEESGLTTKMTAVVNRMTEGRRENKMLREQEYECKIKKDDQGTWWIPRSVLVKGGWEKALKQVDDRINMRESMFARPLTQENVKKHFTDVGLEEEFSTHMRIGALSGGQKVKVVLGAALWNRPHIMILDEPTNYLDRDSLGALAGAIREFEGGVVMITHNSQFCDDLCPQVWHLENNTLNVKGDADWMAMEMLKEEKEQDSSETTDRFGNTVVVKQKLTGKQIRAARKAKAQRRRDRKKRGEDPNDTDSEDWEK
jgi:elongation factor 3